jgi:anti-sigma B factor antagonist
MSLEVHKIGAVLDNSTCAQEQEDITGIISTGNDVMLNLTDCTYVSSAGLRVLLYSYKIAKSKGLKLFLIGVSDDVKEVMKMTGFEKFFTYYATEDECKSHNA